MELNLGNFKKYGLGIKYNYQLENLTNNQASQKLYHL